MEKYSAPNNSPVYSDAIAVDMPSILGDVSPTSTSWSHSRGADLKRPIHLKYHLVLKTLIDIIISSVIVVAILSWLIPFLALIIKLDSKGPVFFLQKRKKQGGKRFTCIKFRSMIVNDDADIIAAREDDERITRVGRMLRKYHIDELPQLFNVLRGDMSIIGPRPYMLHESAKYELLIEGYSHRYTVKPGITGLAQSYGHFGTVHTLEMASERVSLDVRYIKEWSLLMDMKIVLRTFLMLTGISRSKAL
jgi:putative colanic acid biosysnthesis UDP-glucose lipid carrier transferase